MNRWRVVTIILCEQHVKLRGTGNFSLVVLRHINDSLKMFEPFSICEGQSNSYAEQCIESSLYCYLLLLTEISTYSNMRQLWVLMGLLVQRPAKYQGGHEVDMLIKGVFHFFIKVHSVVMLVLPRVHKTQIVFMLILIILPLNLLLK
jgi:hypothetical protein